MVKGEYIADGGVMVREEYMLDGGVDLYDRGGVPGKGGVVLVRGYVIGRVFVVGSKLVVRWILREGYHWEMSEARCSS